MLEVAEVVQNQLVGQEQTILEEVLVVLEVEVMV
jgi:hypothetical protein